MLRLIMASRLRRYRLPDAALSLSRRDRQMEDAFPTCQTQQCGATLERQAHGARRRISASPAAPVNKPGTISVLAGIGARQVYRNPKLNRRPPVGGVSIVLLVKPDTIFDHSQKAEKERSDVAIRSARNAERAAHAAFISHALPTLRLTASRSNQLSYSRT